MEKMLIDLASLEDVKEFVGIVRNCPYNVDVLSQQYIIDGKSILGLLSLDLNQPVEVFIRGERCEEIVFKLEKFVHK